MIVRIKKEVLYLLPVIFLVLVPVVIAGFATTILGSRSLWVAITVGNQNPAVIRVQTLDAITPVENGTVKVYVVFNASDSDGTSNLASSWANISINGVRRVNNSCTNYTEFNGSIRTYNCTILINYWDNSTNWDVNTSVKDAAGVEAFNDTKICATPVVLTVNTLDAMQLINTSINLGNQNLGATNVEGYFRVNNTGNTDFSNINITPFALNASLTDFFQLTGNFSVNTTQSASGYGTGLVNATPVNISDSRLWHAQPAGPAGEYGNLTVYIYVDVPTSGLTTDALYNASRAWLVWAGS